MEGSYRSTETKWFDKKKYCNDNPICISSFYKQKALILEEENTFLPVIIDKSNDVIDFDIDHHHISCSKQNLKILFRTCYAP